MTQLVHNNTSVTGNSSALIDIILSTNPECHQITNVYKLAISDHYLVYTGLHRIELNKTPNVHHQIRYCNYKKFKLCDLIDAVQQAQVMFNITEFVHVNDAWLSWKDTFLTICNKHAPIRESRLKNNHNNLINDEIVKLMY